MTKTSKPRKARAKKEAAPKKTSKKKLEVVALESGIYQPDVCVPVKDDVVMQKYPRATLIGEFALNMRNDNIPIRWYAQENPDRSKGHKDLFGLLLRGDMLMITGVDLDDERFKEERNRQGIHCLDCDTITYSRYRHDYHSCKCGKVSVDGGPAYFKCGFETGANYKTVTIDLATQKVIK